MNIEKMRAKLVSLCVARHELELEKKEANSQFNSDLRGYKRQIEAISEALDKDDPDTILASKMSEDEKKELLGDQYDQGTLFAVDD